MMPIVEPPIAEPLWRDDRTPTAPPQDQTPEPSDYSEATAEEPAPGDDVDDSSDDAAPADAGPRTWLIIMLLVAALVLASGIAFWVFFRPGAPANPGTSPSVSAPATDPSPTPSIDGAKTRVFRLQVGDCFNTQPLSDSQWVYAWVISCTTSHNAEVFYVGTVASDAYPTDDQWGSFTDTLCSPQFNSYVGQGWDSVNLAPQSIYPSQSAWDAGTKTIVCFAQDMTGPVTQSFADTNANQ